MDPDRWRRVEDLFHQALERDEPARGRFLNEHCHGDPELRREVDQWLAADAHAPAHLAAAVGDAVRSLHTGLAPGARMGPYEILALQGEGGMGSVYRARRSDDVFHKEVAIKVVRRGMDSDAVVRRFQRERRILARLEHPNIARVLDGGSTGEGQPYLVMEFIDGVAITDYCRAQALDLRARLALFIPICSGLAHAHDNLVVHRDIKPGNILIDRTGTPKLLDFGISTLLQAEGLESEGSSTQTITALTPQYASPEQVQGEVPTTRADVYSLGTVLYEVVTGVRAHQIDKLTPKAIDEAVAVHDVALPSTVAGDTRLARRLTGDLDNIVMRALQKDPNRRYESAAALATDIRRYLDDLPVHARPDARLYRIGKFVKRHRTLVSATAAVFVALTVGIAVAVRQARVAEQRELQVRSLAKVFLFDVHDKVRDLPGATATRQFIVETAVRYLDALAGSAPSEPEVLRELAAGYTRVGDIQGGDSRGANLGHLDAALVSYRKAAHTLDTLIERSPSDRLAAMDRLRVQDQISEVEAGSIGLLKALPSVAAAVEIGRALLARYPGDREMRQLVADVVMSAGQRQRLGGDLDASLALTTEALTILRDLKAGAPGNRELLALVATGEAAVGMTQARLDNLQEALAHYQRAATQNEELLAIDPQSVDVRRNLAVDYGHVGDVLGNPALPSLGDAVGAEQAFVKMAALNRALYQADPGDMRAASDYTASLLRLGLVIPLSRAADKFAYLDEGVTLARTVLRKSPSNLGMKQTEATFERVLGDFFRDSGRAREAAAHYGRSMAAAEPLIGTGVVTPSRTFVQAASELARIEARSQRPAAAFAVLDRALGVAEKVAAREAFGGLVGGNELLPRVYAARSDVYSHAGNSREAAAWRAKALATWKQLSVRPGFTALMRKEMDALAAGHSNP